MPPRLASRRLASRRLASRSVPGAGETWVDTEPPAGTTTSAMVAHPTEKSIGLDIEFTEGVVTLVSATAEFRFADGTGRRDALEFWPTRPTSGSKNVYGSVLDLEAGTAYQIRAWLNWSDGSHSFRIASATTRNIAIPLASTLTPTRYVDPVNGNDANPGTSAALAWATYAKFAATYPSGGIVTFLSNGNKVYLTSASPQLNRGTVTMISDAVIIDDTNATVIGGQSTEITAGGRVTIEPGAVTAPTGYVPTYDTWVTPAPWVQVQLTGPAQHGNPPATDYTVWRWTGCPVSNPERSSYAVARDGVPQQLGCWIYSVNNAAADTTIDTPEKWAEALFTNLQYRFGFYPDPASPTTIYARLPGDLDPNTLWTWFGNGAGVDFRSANCRISGFSIHDFRYAVQAQSSGSGGAGSGFVIDRNLLQNCFRGVYNSGGADAIIERNIWRDTKLWASQTALSWDATVIPWKSIKEEMIYADLSISVTNKLMGNAESSFAYPNSGGRKATIRYNTLLEGFNGIGIPGTGANSTTRTRGDNCDIHHNYLARLSDDAFEPEGTCINVRIWANTVRECLAGLSIAPIHFGPIYMWRCTFWELGSLGTGRSIDGTVRPAGKGLKMASTNAPESRTHVIHCTFDIDQTDPNGLHGFGISNPGSTFRPALWIKNSIITATQYVIDSVTNGRFVEDYNFLCTTDTTRGIRVGVDTIATTPTDYDGAAGRTFADYRAATGQGANSNLVDQVTKEINAADWLADVRAMWSDRDAGDLTLVTGCAAINRGTPIPNISDRAGIDYLGSAPDLGFAEKE